MACRDGLALMSDLLLWKVRIATNSRNVVKNMQGFGMGSYGHIIREIKARMMASFTSVEFVHESKNSNVDAHRLAKSLIYESIGLYCRCFTTGNPSQGTRDGDLFGGVSAYAGTRW